MPEQHDDFRYDDPTHTYWFGAAQATGATHAINSAGYGEAVSGRAHAANFLYAGERGRAVHSMCHLDDLGQAEGYDMDENLLGYLEAWRRFKREFQFVPDPEACERPIGHRLHRYGVTPDSAGESLFGYMVVERKVRELARKDWLQLQAQKMAIRDVLGRPVKCGRVVQLRGDGTYRSPDAPMSPQHAKALFLAAVDIANDIIAHGR